MNKTYSMKLRHTYGQHEERMKCWMTDNVEIVKNENSMGKEYNGFIKVKSRDKHCFLTN